MSTLAQNANPLDDPHVREHPGTVPFWKAAAQGRFVLPTCTGCGKAHWYPRNFCPFCFSDAIEWRESAGTATIYSFTSMPRATPVIVVAYVRLDEGPLMLTNLVDCDPAEPAIDRRVKVKFVASESGRMLPMFTLA
ncbi:MAG: OB-fold domain-containing protein [Burkholderiaceae bacterium]|nr:OB-fold domain-containing protein [Burkholderiaceae bacterium]